MPEFNALILQAAQVGNGNVAAASPADIRAPRRVRRVYISPGTIGTSVTLLIHLPTLAATPLFKAVVKAGEGPVDFQNLTGVGNDTATGGALEYTLTLDGGTEIPFIKVDWV